MNTKSDTTNAETQKYHTDSFEEDNAWFSEHFESVIPKIQKTWPDIARQTIESTRGSFEELVKVISENTDKTSYGVRDQLRDIFEEASLASQKIATSLEPFEKQLEDLIDELNQSLRPKIEKSIRQKPLVALGVAAGIGIVLGLMLSGGSKDHE